MAKTVSQILQTAAYGGEPENRARDAAAYDAMVARRPLKPPSAKATTEVPLTAAAVEALKWRRDQERCNIEIPNARIARKSS